MKSFRHFCLLAIASICLSMGASAFAAETKCYLELKSGGGAIYLNGDMVAEAYAPKEFDLELSRKGSMKITISGMLPSSFQSACVHGIYGSSCKSGRGTIELYVHGPNCY